MGPIWMGRNIFAEIFAKIREKTCVRTVVDYADTTITTQTNLEKLWKFLTDFKGKIRQKMYLDVFTNPIEII